MVKHGAVLVAKRRTCEGPDGMRSMISRGLHCSDKRDKSMVLYSETSSYEVEIGCRVAYQIHRSPAARNTTGFAFLLGSNTARSLQLSGFHRLLKITSLWLATK